MGKQRARSRLIKDIDKLVRPHGWTWSTRGGGHVIWRGPGGKGLVVTSATPSGNPEIKRRIVSEFRRQGCDI